MGMENIQACMSATHEQLTTEEEVDDLRRRHGAIAIEWVLILRIEEAYSLELEVVADCDIFPKVSDGELAFALLSEVLKLLLRVSQNEGF